MGNALKKETKRTVTKKSYSWATLLYPESCCSDYAKILVDMAIPCLISPLHDKDVNEDGTPKKPHYHVLMKFKTQKSNLQVEDIVSKISGAGCECIHDAGQYARYLTHMDDEDKAQYDASSVQIIGDIDYLKLTAPKLDTLDAFVEIIDLIENNDICTYTELIMLCRRNRPELMKVAIDKSYSLNIYLRGINQTEQRKLKREHDIQVAKTEQLLADGWTPVGGSIGSELFGKQLEVCDE